MKLHQRCLFYAMSGVFTEVLFTALKSLHYHRDIMLHGNTQLWVIAIYAVGGLLFEQVNKRVPNRVYRQPVYLALLYALEYTYGWILMVTLGRCPWHYHEPGNVHGLIQLYYAPMWLLFVALADYGVEWTISCKIS